MICLPCLRLYRYFSLSKEREIEQKDSVTSKVTFTTAHISGGRQFDYRSLFFFSLFTGLFDGQFWYPLSI